VEEYQNVEYNTTELKLNIEIESSMESRAKQHQETEQQKWKPSDNFQQQRAAAVGSIH